MNELSSTRQHKQKVEAYKNIVCVFVLDDKPKTWTEIWKESGLTKTRFSTRFRELVKSSHIQHVKSVENPKRLGKIKLYQYTGKPLIYNLGEDKDDVSTVYAYKNGTTLKHLVPIETRRRIRRMGRPYTRRVPTSPTSFENPQ